MLSSVRRLCSTSTPASVLIYLAMSSSQPSTTSNVCIFTVITCYLFILWEPDTSATRHFGTTKLVPKFKTNHQWSCVSSELSWVEVSRLFLDHGTRVEVSRTTFLVSKCLEIGAEVSQSVLMPKCLVAEVSGRPYVTCADYENECVALYLAAIRQKEHSAV